MRTFSGDLTRSDKELEGMIQWNRIEKRDNDERFWAFKPTEISLLMLPDKTTISNPLTTVQLSTATTFTWLPTKHYSSFLDFVTNTLRVECGRGQKVENKSTVVC